MSVCRCFIAGVVALAAAGVLCLASVPGEAVAGDSATPGRVSVPKPARGKGTQCVADTDFMRRNHMDLLKHQRDDTVYDGIRTRRFSLKECLTCHAVKGPDARPVTVKSPEHFCRTCHDYVAVKIDCFQCHASRSAGDVTPGGAASLPSSRSGRSDAAALANYLKGVPE